MKPCDESQSKGENEMATLKFKYLASYCVLMTIVFVLSIGIVNGNTAENKQGYMDPKAIEVLKNVSENLAAAKTFSMKATAIYDRVMASGVIVTYAKEVEVYVQRPDKFFATITGDNLVQRRIYFDGKSLIRLNVEKNTYQKIPYNGDINGVLDHVIDHYDMDLPLADWIYNDIAGEMKKNIISAEHMGERIVKGVPCHHLSFESTGADWQVWVKKWEKPVLGRFAINFINIDENPRYLAMFKEWRLNLELDEQIFTFTPPFEAREVEIKKSAGSKTVD
jgi:hypothetical protein